jgi:glycosyltransferase involved in cell wall biosynthesis
VSIIDFSIVTTSFNKADFIEETIQSVLSQERDFSLEYIVIDGGSTDGTLNLLKKYGDLIRWVSEPDDGSIIH